MRTLHNRTKSSAVRSGRKTAGHHGRRLASLLLCLCMVISMLCNVGGLVMSSAAQATDHVTDRKADPNTMDDYQKRLLSADWGSRYAGRVWTDKSVFAYDASESGSNLIGLDMETDGYEGDVGFSADFAHVFSALASSQVVNEYPPSPIDLVIVFDMSASMGQDTRYSLDTGGNQFCAHSGDVGSWPEAGVLMSERIEHSRIQETLTAINDTIDKLMAQNPQNRVAVCCYGANATVLMPLAHYKKNKEMTPYLSVGGMETLYYPGDLVWRDAGTVDGNAEGWYWVNNRDTCYTVTVDAQYNESTGPLKGGQSWDDTDLWEPLHKTVSNNVRSSNVKAFPGAAEPAQADNVEDTIKNNSKAINKDGIDGTWIYAHQKKELVEAVADTEELEANDYVGYLTNTQGGIYLAYKQLADSKATTYTEELSNGKISTVARIPSAIIMSDGGANFAFNKMGSTSDSWYKRFGVAVNSGDLNLLKSGSWNEIWEENSELLGKYCHTPGVFGSDLWYINDNTYDTTTGDSSVHDEDLRHRLNENVGDEWYNVYLPGKDTLDDGWDGLHSLYNIGADIYQDGTLSSIPSWNGAGVFYSNDSDWIGTPATILQVTLTAAYMNTVVGEHYQLGWQRENASEESRIALSTYTMNVDTSHVPQWGRWRLFPTLDPKEYPLDSLTELVNQQPKNFANQYGADNWDDTGGFNQYKDTVLEGITREWGKLKSGTLSDDAKATQDMACAKMAPIADNYTYGSGDDAVSVTHQSVIDHIAYNDAFYDVNSGNLKDIFDSILEMIIGSVFVPVSGDNDAGVGDAVTYQDPIGEYMEVKNGSINAIPYHTNDDLTDPQPTDYDMAMLLFGEMHGLSRAGVYDWHWNDQWMQAHASGGQGSEPLPEGWYFGEAASAKSGGDGSVPEDGGVALFATATDARAAGWVYRLSYRTAAQYVPVLSGVTSPSTVPEQMRNTVYTVYRFDCNPQDRDLLRRNPIYGSGVPEGAQEIWKNYGESNGGVYPNHTYDVPGLDQKTYPGLYRLNDIRVWMEDTGDFIDQEGSIAPNSGYDRSLYVNIPAAAVPTQLATITLGREGVLSYETNLGSDHEKGTQILGEDGEPIEVDEQMYKNFCYQSTPLRLFYAVGLEEDLILRDDEGQQIGVDFNAISPEYISSHTVAGQNYVWFLSNYYSATRYGDYATDDDSHTRGDPTVTFSPSADNRYYVFQKPLPLFAHAYRLSGGELKPVDGGSFGDHKEGNGKTLWENDVTGGAGWTGGQYMGTYKDATAFLKALQDKGDGNIITDSSNVKYEFVEDGIVFLQEDMLQHVTSADDGYAEGSVSFSSDDYFFLLVEYYVPEEDSTGADNEGNDVPGTQKGHMVQYALARKGSEFGSGYTSGNISNGDMLCWTDTQSRLNVEFAYVSRTETGDDTRGEPTFQKLTLTDENELREYLRDVCHISAEKQVPNPDYNPDEPESQETISALEQQVAYWKHMQEDVLVQAALKAAAERAEEEVLSEDGFKQYFTFSVAARPGGIRSGDMSNNLQYKGESYNSATQLYDRNRTETSNTYYLPTISDNSGTNDHVIINNYLGNNGRLEIANQMLHVTKMLEAPEGFTLTDEQLDEEFHYQIYVQGVTGNRSAVRTQYNKYAKVWERELAYIDVLTDNSDLVLDNNSRRATFISAIINSGPAGDVQTAKMVVEYDGFYYEANEDGTLTMKNGAVDTNVNRRIEEDEPIYYLYLPSNGDGASAEHTRRLYQNKEYDGSADGYVGTYAADQERYDTLFQPNGMTTFVNDGDHAITGTEPGADNRDSYRLATSDRPAGCKTYWAQDAELIPVDEVTAAETVVGDTAGEIAAYAADTINSTPIWTHDPSICESSHTKLTYYNLVIRRPEEETSETAFISPLMSRSQYMTVELVFGQNANADVGGNAPGSILETGDLYDDIVPSADRPDLFDDKTKEDIAANTAEFTLKHGEGLLFTGLDNRIAYRFTEKLTDEQLAKGYTLKQISHIQQRGSESIYKPGVQNIPIYTKTGSTYGSEYGSAAQNQRIENELTWARMKDGTENADAQKQLEPFAHTNAIMWEYYATMDANSSGNHHQPDDAKVKEEEESLQIWDQNNPNQYTSEQGPHTVADNPSCVSVESADQLVYGKCDLPQADGTTLHYMYYKGELLDPHYEGEASTYLRNMARYGVSPTVHFGVEEETQESTNGVPSRLLETGADKDYYDYDGVYSVYGNTGWFEEQANYTNTISPEMLVVTKQIVDKGGEVVATPPNQEFTFTIRLTPSGKEAIKANGDILYIWQGLRGNIGNTPEEGGAPALDRYREYIEPAASGQEASEPYLKELKPDAGGSEGETTYTVKLKANEAVVIYGLVAGTDYTVIETKNEDYPAVDPQKPHTGQEEGFYAQNGKITHNQVDHVAMKPVKTGNRNDFYNLISTGALTVEKRIMDDDAWEVGKAFTFTVTLTPKAGTSLDKGSLTMTKVIKTEAGTETSEELTGIEWSEETAEGKTTFSAEFTLKHGEQIVIGGIPLDTEYIVKETGRDGYNLQYVTDNPTETEEENFIHPEDFGVNGEITETQTQAYWLFMNAKLADLPFTGGFGVWLFYGIGALALFASVMIFAGHYKKRRPL